MKRPLVLLVLAAPLLFVLPRVLAPRISQAQTSAPTARPTRRLPPLPSPLSPEDARREVHMGGLEFRSPAERHLLLEKATSDWRALAKQNGDIVLRAQRMGAPVNPVQVRLFAKPPFDPARLQSIPLRSRYANWDDKIPTWMGDLKLWMRVDGVDPRVLPSASGTPRNGTTIGFGGGFGMDWTLDANVAPLGVRRTANSPWQDPPFNTRPPAGDRVLTRSELFNWKDTPWICTHVRSWGGGQWRYVVSSRLNVPRYFQPNSSQPFPSNPFESYLELIPLRVETDAPVYGGAQLPPPWPRTRFDVVSSQTPLLQAIEFFDTDSHSWKKVPGRGESGFPLALSQEEQIGFRVTPLDPKRPWPDSPSVYPRWKATRDGIVISEDVGQEQQYIRSWTPPRDDKIGSAPGFVKEVISPNFTSWRVRPSKSASDLMTISVSAGNTLQTQVRVLPHPTPTPLPTNSPFSASASSVLGNGWGSVQYLSPMRKGEGQQGALWAIQKLPIGLKDPKFRASLWVNSDIGDIGLKVVFHSRFDDGTPCGTWSDGKMPIVNRGRDNDAVATFHPPSRTGKGVMWVEVLNRNREQIGRSKDEPFAVYPLAVSCGITEWQPTQNSDEWSREIRVFAGAQVSDPTVSYISRTTSSGKMTPPVKVVSRTTTYTISPMAGVPVRVSVQPSPLVDTKIMPLTSLSSTKGLTVTTAPSTGSSQYVETTPPVLGTISGAGLYFSTTQTVQWKLGNSNQIDCTRIVAQLDLPPAQMKTLSAKGSGR